MEQNAGGALALRAQERFLEELREVNTISARFGLRLSEQGMLALSQARTLALTDHGRVELGASAVRSIVDGFCDSPYLLQEDYETTLLELVDAFYYFKNACGEQLTDAELIEMAHTTIPLRGKLLMPDQIARTAVFLASDDADAVTGQVVHVNGGSYMP